jgi:hypothetical protein
MHLLYALIALMLVGVLALSSMRMSTQSEQRMISNEIMTQVTGLADEVFDHADAYWFDERTNEQRVTIQPPIFPIIQASQTSDLTSPSAVPGIGSDGWSGCTDAIYAPDANTGQMRLQNAARPQSCDDLDDLHGLRLDMDRGGLTYRVDVSVEYVEPLNPTNPSASQTFAKRLSLRIVTEDYQIAGNPLEVEMSRVFTYDRVTQSATP